MICVSRLRTRVIVSFGALVAIAQMAVAAADEDLTNLDLEQLMNEPVTSVSKRETPLSESPAAITVVTQDDLRRMGITTLPEETRPGHGCGPDWCKPMGCQRAWIQRGVRDQTARID